MIFHIPDYVRISFRAPLPPFLRPRRFEFVRKRFSAVVSQVRREREKRGGALGGRKGGGEKYKCISPLKTQFGCRSGAGANAAVLVTYATFLASGNLTFRDRAILYGHHILKLLNPERETN